VDSGSHQENASKQKSRAAHIPTMPSCACFARQVKRVSVFRKNLTRATSQCAMIIHLDLIALQVLDFAIRGYCAWGCFGDKTKRPSASRGRALLWAQPIRDQ
jgi:hypothetical protein